MTSATSAYFFGTFTPRLDEKGRLFLPAKFRPMLSEGVVLTRGQDHCVYGWTPEAFEEFSTRARQASFSNNQARNFIWMLFGGAAHETPDKQGRVPVSALLREWAALDRDCTVVGTGERFEIWDSVKWHEFSEQNEEGFADLSEEIYPGIF